MVKPLVSTILLLEPFGSQPSGSREKCLRGLTKLRISDSVPHNLSMLINTCMISYTSLRQQRHSFSTNWSGTVFHNELRWRTEVPLYKLRTLTASVVRWTTRHFQVFKAPNQWIPLFTMLKHVGTYILSFYEGLVFTYCVR